MTYRLQYLGRDERIDEEAVPVAAVVHSLREGDNSLHGTILTRVMVRGIAQSD